MPKGQYNDFSCKLDESGWDEILKQMNYLDEREIEYGYPDRGVKHKESGESIVDIAHWNNDGVKDKSGTKWHIPPRDFMDVADMLTEDEMFKYNDIIQDAISNKGLLVVDKALNKVGDLTADNVREAIDLQIYKPLAPSTVRLKGSSVILIETGQLYEDATSKIKMKGDD